MILVGMGVVVRLVFTLQAFLQSSRRNSMCLCAGVEPDNQDENCHELGQSRPRARHNGACKPVQLDCPTTRISS